MANIIDGKVIAASVKEEVKNRVADFKKQYKKDITLAVVLVGEDPASKIYVSNKMKAAEYVGIKSLSFTLPAFSSQESVETLVKSLASDKSVDGILVQLPLPKGLDADKILSLIPAEKDVDGFSAENMGALALFKECVAPCTPSGIIRLIKSTGENLSGKYAVIVGRSNIVGKPVALMLLKENCTVTICHSKTQNLKDITSKADILVSAIGSPKFITEDMVKENAVVIDVGINRTEAGLVGDVDFNAVKEKAAFITPVPGGVGPMTIAMLMSNACDCALRRKLRGI